MEASVKSVTEPAKFSQVLGLSPGDNLDFNVAFYQRKRPSEPPIRTRMDMI